MCYIIAPIFTTMRDKINDEDMNPINFFSCQTLFRGESNKDILIDFLNKLWRESPLATIKKLSNMQLPIEQRAQATGLMSKPVKKPLTAF